MTRTAMSHHNISNAMMLNQHYSASSSITPAAQKWLQRFTVSCCYRTVALELRNPANGLCTPATLAATCDQWVEREAIMLARQCYLNDLACDISLAFG